MKNCATRHDWTSRPAAWLLFGAAVFAAVLCTSWVRAEEQGTPRALANSAPVASEPDVKAESSESPPAPDAQTIRTWIGDLESPSQATRSAAQASLQRAGAPALDQVIAAARSPHPEVRLRSVDILRRHAAGDNASLAQAGQTALGNLARAADTSVARAAESAIAANARQRAADEIAQHQGQIVLRGGGAIIRLRPRVVLRAEAMPAGVRSVSISVTNGKRSIVARSGDERVEIADGGDEGIKMTITKKVDGKEKQESFAAKDADELRAKHAEAFKVYEQYAKDGGAAAVLGDAKFIRKTLPAREEPPAER